MFVWTNTRECSSNKLQQIRRKQKRKPIQLRNCCGFYFYDEINNLNNVIMHKIIDYVVKEYMKNKNKTQKNIRHYYTNIK